MKHIISILTLLAAQCSTSVSTLSASAEQPCATSSDTLENVSNTAAAPLQSRCLATTRALALEGSPSHLNVTLLAFVLNAETKVGLAKYRGGDITSAFVYWRHAVSDEQLLDRGNAVSTESVSNPGLAAFEAGKYASAFAWYLRQYAESRTSIDVSLTDGGFYPSLEKGLSLASKGRYSDASKSLKVALAISSTASDALFLLGMVDLAARRWGAASTHWAAAIGKYSFKYGNAPRVGPNFAVSAAYLWMNYCSKNRCR